MTRAEYREARRHMNRWERRAWEDGCIRITSKGGGWELTEYGRMQLWGLAACAFVVTVMVLAMVV